MEDIRVLWIKCVIRNNFNLSSDVVFDDFLNRDARINEIKLIDFLDGRGSALYPSILFMTRRVRETIFEEVIIQLDSEASSGSLVVSTDGDLSRIVNDDETSSIPLHLENSVSAYRDQRDDQISRFNKKLVPREIEKLRVEAFYDIRHLPNQEGPKLCLIKTIPGKLEAPSSLLNACKRMPSFFEITFFFNCDLYQLSSLIEQIYLRRITGTPSAENESKAKALAKYLGDFNIASNKFMKCVAETINILRAKPPFMLPNITLGVNDQNILSNERSMSIIEATVLEWSHQVRDVLDELHARTPTGKGPLAVIDLWRSRVSVVNRIVEQTKLEEVQRIVHLYSLKEHVHADIIFEDLRRFHNEAKDNIKLLTLVERYFKILTYSPSIQEVIDSLSPLMQALQMIWIISRYFSKDDRMTVLFEEIAWCLCNRASHMLDFSELFSLPVQDMGIRIANAKKLLVCWKSTYMSRRADIEASGRDYRWEFDKNRLFSKSDHIIRICTDLESIVAIIGEYHKIFGPKLRSMVSDHKHIDSLMENVTRLPTHFTAIKYDPLIAENKSKWQVTLDKFDLEVKDLDTEAKGCIEDIFRSIASSKWAYSVIEQILRQCPRSGIIQMFEDRYEDVYDRYISELRIIETIFTEGLVDSGKFSAHLGPRFLPPVSASIFWARHLFRRLKAPMLKLLQVKKEYESPKAKETRDSYLCLARRLKQFEERLFTKWKHQSEDEVRELLERKLWQSVERTSMSKTSVFSMARVKSGRSSITTDSQFHRHSKFGKRMPKPKKALRMFNFTVTCGDKLWEIVSETMYLESLGFVAPATTRNVTIRQKELFSHKQKLEDLARAIFTTLQSLSSVEYITLEPHVMKIWTALLPASERLNWNSLVIDEFIIKATRVHDDFCAMLQAIAKFTQTLESHVRQISAAKLFGEHQGAHRQPLLPCKNYFQHVSDARSRLFEDIFLKHAETSHILMKIESIVTGHAATGKSPQMVYYYEYWERRIFDTVHQMVLNNLQGHLIRLQVPPAPLFFVDLVLLESDCVCMPQPMEFFKFGVQDVRDAVKTAQTFLRWQPDTCLPAPGIKEAGTTEEPFYYSFYLDLVRSESVREVVQQIDTVVLRCAEEVKRWQEKFRRHKVLFAHHKKSQVDRFRRTSVSVIEIHERINHLTNQMDDLISNAGDKQIEFVLLRTSLLVRGIRDHARKWTEAFGEIFRERARNASREIRDLVRIMRTKLQVQPHNLGKLKSILQTIRDISDARLESSEKLELVSECHRLLRLHGLKISPSEAEEARTASEVWRDLWKEAARTQRNLGKIRRKFTYSTRREVLAYSRELKAFHKRFVESGPGSVGDNLQRGYELLKEYEERLQDMDMRHNELLSAQKLFDLPLSSYSELLQVQHQLHDLKPIYTIFLSFSKLQQEWSHVLWRDAQFSILHEEVDKLLKDLRKLPRSIRDLNVGRGLERRLCDFRDSLPLFKDLKHQALKPRHWGLLMDRIEHDFALKPEEFTLASVFEMHLHRFRGEINEILGIALKEESIEKSLAEIRETWNSLRLGVKEHTVRGASRGLVIRGVAEVLQTLDDSALALQSIAGGVVAAASPFTEEVHQLGMSLRQVSEVLEAWTAVQMKWLCLQGVFIGQGDIRAQLPREADKFDKLNTLFRKTVNEVVKDPLVSKCCLKPGRASELQAISSGFEVCEKSLSDYLQCKRNAFPRFFFVSDDELLTILGASSATDWVQEYLIKMFENIARLKFTTGGALVTGMESVEGEEMTFRGQVTCEGRRVEEWMPLVETEMKRTNRALTKEAIFQYCDKTTRVDWALLHNGMVALAASQVWGTWEVEDAFQRLATGDRNAMKTYAEQKHRQLEQIVARVRRQLGQNERTKLTTLLITDVHARDVVDGVVRDGVTNINDFEWQSQLRFYWLKPTNCLQVLQCNASFSYGFEYSGLSGRLVMTPLTERIYLTLTQALSMHLGGAPVGPAGTGKTETIKDLAKALGNFCLVTNCGEGMDYRAVGKIFAGLCQCGAWGCFDEFNRIDVSVLSAISSQLRVIQSALVQKASKFTFEGDEMAFSPNVGVFITMNPGYAGRTELPESVKVMFRPVVVALPDRVLICEVILFSQGFREARQLATKMDTLYKMAEDQLSKQHHYDFSMRALKAVLLMAGELRRDETDLDDATVLMQALRDLNLPRFTYEDAPLFLGLINDLFPDAHCPKADYPELCGAIDEWLLKEKYSIIPKQVSKVIQLYETMRTRHTTMVIGPTGGGKTVMIEALCGAQTSRGFPTKLITMNPKDRSVIELYGVLDPATSDWTDGLLSRLFREANRVNDTKENTVLLLDGDVDPLWVENMNSVMDDNRLLTLPNGERIRMQPTCALLFEVGDLEHASPATVSRSGMVFVDPRDLEYAVIWQRWISSQTFDAFARQNLESLFVKYIPRIMERKIKTVLPMGCINLVSQFCSFLESAIDRSLAGSGEYLEAVFVQAIAFGIGGCIEESELASFDEHLKEMTVMPNAVGDCAALSCIPTTRHLLSDFYVDSKKQEWVPWDTKVPAYVHSMDRSFSDIFVPTQETTIIQWMLEMHLAVDKPLLIVGPSGTSKTVSIDQCLKSKDKEKHTPLTVSLSSQTTAGDLHRFLDSCLEKRAKRVYGPAGGKRLLVFIDNMNMPEPDSYGTQQPIAFLKLLLTNKGFYDRDKDMQWKHISGVSLFGAMSMPGNDRNKIDPRFLSKFSMFNVCAPTEHALISIFSKILHGFFDQTFGEGVTSALPAITQAMMKVYFFVLQSLRPTPIKFHYAFNPRDLSRVAYGLCRISPQKCNTLPQLVRLWEHEMRRVFVDRLLTDEDRNLVINKINTEIGDLCHEEYNSCVKGPLLFGEYRTTLQEDGPHLYEEIGDFVEARRIFNEIMEQRSDDSGEGTLVLFDDALDHLSRLHRIMTAESGHALCVGQSGLGKTALAKLAAYSANCDVFQITPVRSNFKKEFIEQIKNLFLKLGFEGRKTVFLFSEEDIFEEGALETINKMLTGNLLPDLYSPEEKKGILNDLQKKIFKSNGAVIKESIWSYFVKRVNQNLHVVLTMSPVGDALRNRCQNFPGLLNSTTIDWFFPWPEEALLAVARTVISADNELIPQGQYESIIEHVVHVHLSASLFTKEYMEKWRRLVFITPRHFFDYTRNYLRLLLEKDTINKVMHERLVGGLKKLADASAEIVDLNTVLVVQREAIAGKSEACETLLNEITTNQLRIADKRDKALTKAKEIEIQSKEIAKAKSAAEEILSAALPALEQARAALDDLEKSDVTEIRSFVKPPRPVQVVSECLCVLKGYSEINWKAAKGMMADPNFLQSLKTMNVDVISSKQLSTVKEFLDQSKIKSEEMKVVSRAGAGLLRFVHTILEYCPVLKDVKHKQENVSKLETTLHHNQRDLEKLNSELDRIQKDLKILNERYRNAADERQTLQEETRIMERRLASADRLIHGLEFESVRWRKDAERLLKERHHLVGDCLIAAAFLSYVGAFPGVLRKRMLLEDWSLNATCRNIPLSEPLNLESLLATEVEVAEFRADGLPGDELSIQNGILATISSRFPLFIDPQEQALSWVKQREAKNDLRIASLGDSDLPKQLELSLKLGSPFLLQNVDRDPDPIIYNVLCKNIVRTTARSFFKLGNKEVDYDPNFRLYLSTKLSNPKYGPKVFENAVVINCAVTQKGLEDQLLGVLVKHEQPRLEEQREKLIFTTSENKRLLEDLEDNLLRHLTLSTGNILDNTELIQTVEESKATATVAADKLNLAVTTSVEVEKVRDTYRLAAETGASLFFTLTDMSSINAMYQFALGAYLGVFEQALRRSMPDTVLKKRIANIIKTLTESTYIYGCTAFFEAHKLLFSFQIALKLSGENDRKIVQSEIDFFTRGDVSVGLPKERVPVSWLTETNWKDISHLQASLPTAFSGLKLNISKNEKKWFKWFSSSRPECAETPPPFNEELTSFQKLCMLRCFRIDRVSRGVESFVAERLGRRYVSPPEFQLDPLYSQCSPSTPIIFVLSPGADPIADLSKFAGRKGLSPSQLNLLSLGQGRETAAMKHLKTASTQAVWLVLQNCHLQMSWLPTLERVFEQIEKFHPDFRLWLTTEPEPNFPVGILQKSVKIVMEPLRGLKRNLKSAFMEVPTSKFVECPHPAFSSLVFSLSFFHAVIQERRQYGKLGWNIPYDFNQSDFHASLAVIEERLKCPEIPWKSLRYLIQEVMYGGRVTDAFDRRILQTYMSEYFGDFIFDDCQKFHFYVDRRVDFCIPTDNTRKGLINYIDTLPANSTPKVLGLERDTEIHYLTTVTQELWAQMLHLSGEGGGDHVETSSVLQMVEDILESLPAQFDREAMKEDFKNKISPTSIVLLQELKHFNRLLDRMQVSLVELKRAIRGETAMSTDLEDISRCLRDGRLPTTWRHLAPATRKSLAEWLVHFHQREQQYRQWAASGEPAVIWLSGLHGQSAYLSAILQTVCRRNAWSLDRSGIFTTVTEHYDPESIEGRNYNGFYVNGLYIKGAGWNPSGSCLSAQLPRQKRPINALLPILSVGVMEKNRIEPGGTVRVPVYVTAERANAAGEGLAFVADLPTGGKDASHWILRGVCLLLNCE